MRTHLVFGSDFSRRERPRGHLVAYNNLLRKPASSASKPLWNFILSKHHQKSYITIYIFIYILNIYIYIYLIKLLNPKIVKPHTISTHISKPLKTTSNPFVHSSRASRSPFGYLWHLTGRKRKPKQHLAIRGGREIVGGAVKVTSVGFSGDCNPRS